MFSTDDTIVAVATPSGHGGLGVVRLSGPDAPGIAATLAGRDRPWVARRVTRARIAAAGAVADVLVTSFTAPASYTGEDVVEIAAHGNPLLLAAIVERAVASGARPAARGEFTLRAFLHGKLDLIQAEAVRDVVEAVSPAQLRAASSQLAGGLSARVGAIAADLRRLETLLEASIDFPDEGYRFVDTAAIGATLESVRERMRALVDDDQAALVRDGVTVVITGAPNVGKSSLFNALVGADRAIVTPVPGTTRDLVSERLVIGSSLIRLVDTAGLRATDDVVEAEGVRRATTAAATADVIVAVVDRSTALDAAALEAIAGAGGRTIVVASKCDRPAAWSENDRGVPVLTVSAVTGEGVPALARAISGMAESRSGVADADTMTSARQRAALRASLTAVERACNELGRLGQTLPEEFVLADLRSALDALDGMVGRRTAQAMLHEIFSEFCIGK